MRSNPAARTFFAPPPGQTLSGDRGAERLIGLGFRHWVAGYKSGDIDRWEDAWRIYSSALGPNSARTAVTELSAWVRAVSAAARREIEVCAGEIGRAHV